ncbi:tetratricopeptide (TPR) repeat protein [Crossiella equi]|uniref:Tetratricopeptide (TPR) repeat protein n=1 Tax=Crossiella equi TaxID=130796 RepID=A0ABS5ACY6_9PSEU|nr:NB-ARC domain-containing protein [Crossiella equi]MBP2474454.1 tetratricopeptide (TPR) repeat protein [Crossiella equi]
MSSSADNRVSGLVQGTVVQANTVGGVVITAALPETAVPQQLPPGPQGFVNRHAQLDQLAALHPDRHPDRPGVVVLSGLGGVGKTALGLHWAHRHRAQFPGGLFYADLAGYRQRGTVEVSDVLAAFLRALGVYDAFIPAEQAERAALFRTRTASAPVLLLLDNVDHAAQVRALLPGSPGSGVIVTSRNRLSGLLLDGAVLLELPPLSSEDASALVGHMLPESRARAESPALRELVRQCAGLPLALRIAGARLVQRPRWPVARLVSELEDERFRLARLSMADDSKVEPVFDAAYLDLPEPVRRAYRRLALLPGLDFDLPAVAVAFESTEDVAAELLTALCEANLVEELGEDRYRLHDLVLLHARRWLAEAEPVAEVERVRQAVVRWYLLGAAAADHQIMGRGRWRCATHDLSAWPVEFTPDTAMAWAERERASLLGACRTAARHGWHDLVWQLCEALFALYYSHQHYADWIETHQLGIVAAERLGDHTVEVRMRNQLARAYLGLGRFEQAAEQLTAAEAVAHLADDPRALAVVLESRGVLWRDQSRYEAAGEEFRAARSLNEELGDRRGVALQSYHLGEVLARSGRPTDALPQLADALRDSLDLGDELLAARVRIVQGFAYGRLHRTAEARSALLTAAETTRERGQPVKEAQALETLVEVAEQGADPDLFTRSASRLAELYQRTGSPRLPVVQGWLTRGRRAAE